MKLCPKCTTGFPDHVETCPTHGGMLSEIRDLKPGMMIRNSYRIVRKLGQGGFGTVYLAQQTLMDEPRALKFLSPELSSDQAFTSRFLREVRMLRQVRNRNVVDCGDLEAAEDNSLFFSMEFVDGPDLRDFLRDALQPFDVDLALIIIRGIAEGLGAAHAKGMVHRDIKPENILMARDGDGWVPKIADFGIVATKESSKTRTRTGSSLLTMPYAAPEQFLGMKASDLDGRTDLYALGGVLFEMLTGQTAFDAESYEGWAEQHKKFSPTAPSSLRPELANWLGLDALVLRLLAKDREQRPKNVAELLNLLDAVRYVPGGSRKQTITEDGSRRQKTITEEVKVRPSEPIPIRPLQPLTPVPVSGSRKFPGWVWGALATLVLVTVFAAVRHFVPQPHSEPIPIPTPQSQTTSTPAPTPQSLPTLPPQPTQQLKPVVPTPNKIAVLRPSTPKPAGPQEQKPAPLESSRPSVQKPSDAKEQNPEPAADSKTPVRTPSVFEIDRQAAALYDQKRYEEAAPLFNQACNAGFARSCMELGVMYLYGRGVPTDHFRGVDLNSKACEGGNAQGCSFLGQAYRYGVGVNVVDEEKAKQLFIKSCRMGDRFGCDALKEMQ